MAENNNKKSDSSTEINKDEAETLLFDHNFQKDTITQALEIVKKFIQMNKRILVGGMSIDMALRTKGDKLYPDNTLPDYDFYSPIFHIDAYTIGDMLTKHFENIDVIRATHVNTMRVRVNFTPVADITYIPQNIYDNIPCFAYQGFRVVHPHFQIIDQHKALSLPYENPPRETIIGKRWKNDIERYDLFLKHFPIISTDVSFTEPNKMKLYELSFDLLDGECLGGYVSLLHWMSKAVLDGCDLSDFADEAIGSFVIDGNIIRVELNQPIYFTIITDNFEEIFERFPGERKFYNSIVDKIPRKILIVGDTDYEIIDNRGRMLGAHRLLSTKRTYVNNLQDVMCYLLTLGVFYKSPLAINAYLIAQRILFWAADQFVKTQDERFLPYLPTNEIYGQYNWAESYLVSIEDLLVFFCEKDRELFTPKNAYPKPGKEVDQALFQFKPEESELYQFDGKETNKLFKPKRTQLESKTDVILKK